MNPSIVIAGGGTGGHVFPAIAVAQAIQKINPQAQISFIGTKLGLEHKLVPAAHFPICYVRVTGLKGKSRLQKIKAILLMPMAVWQSLGYLRKVKATAVLGVGGYASAPALIAAFILRLPIAVCEQNSIPGLTNRLLSHLSRKIFGSFPNYRQLFAQKKFSLAGNPLRSGFEHRQNEATRIKGRIVVIGGSMGASFLNQAVPKAANLLKKRSISFSIIHQCGSKEVDLVKKRFEENNIEAEVLPFIDDMLGCFLSADIVVCRAGATTCTEVMALGLPSLMIPLPTAANDHQSKNASFLSDNQAAVLIAQNEHTAEKLSEEIEKLLNNEDLRMHMANQAFALARTQAAEIIAQSALNKFN